MKKKIAKVLIIGSGPAGYTAAIYAARAGLKPILYKGIQPGGQLTITTDVENYPGYPDGIIGPEMMMAFEKQAARFGTQIYDGVITKVAVTAYPYALTVNGKETVLAESIIIATGASAEWLGIPSEQRLNGKGVSACAVCDGFFFRGQDVAVAGGGDTAAEEASYLSKICTKVYILVRSGKMRASTIMQRRIQSLANVEILWHTTVDEILGREEVKGMRIRDSLTNTLKEYTISGFFVAIGHKPNTDIFKGILTMNKNNYITTAADSTKTSVEGIFAAGDAQDFVYRQAVTAAGTGCMAALDAERFLAAKEHNA